MSSSWVSKNAYVLIGVGLAVVVAAVGIASLARADDEEEKKPASTSATTSSSTVKTKPVSSSTTTLSSTKVGDGEFTKETLREILTTMIGEFVQHKVVQESRKAELEKEGKSQDELNEQLQTEFVQQLQIIEAKIGERFGTNQASLMEAQDKYASDPEIAELMLEMKKILFGEEQFNEIQEAERQAALNLPSHMTSEIFFTVMEKHMAMLDTLFDEKLKEARKETPGANFLERSQYLDFLLQSKIEDVTKKFLREVNLTEPEFKACLIKFGNSRKIMELVMSSQMEQEQKKQEVLNN